MKNKICPSCGYKNPAVCENCQVCGSSVSGISETADIKPGAPVVLAILIAAVMAFALGLFFLKKTRKETTAPYPLLVAEAGRPLNAETLERSINALGGIKLPDEEEKKTVLRALVNQDPYMRLAAGKTLLFWAGYKPEGYGNLLTPALDLLADKSPLVKGNLGYFLAEPLKLGIFSESELAPSLSPVYSYTSDSSEGVRIAGERLFLFLTPRAENYDEIYSNFKKGSPREKIHAACFLALRGDPEFIAYIKKAAKSGEKSLEEDSKNCLKDLSYASGAKF